ncbi:helix-turn-helix domain-containing protein [Pseudomonas sp.]
MRKRRSTARKLQAEGVPVMKIARDIGLSKVTIGRYLKKSLEFK